MPVTTVKAPPGSGGGGSVFPSEPPPLKGSAVSCDPSIQDCAFKLDPATQQLKLVPSRHSTAEPGLPPPLFAEPTNGGAPASSSTTTLLAVGAVIAAGAVAYFLLRK